MSYDRWAQLRGAAAFCDHRIVHGMNVRNRIDGYQKESFNNGIKFN
jgi:hypothetical protein